MSAPCICDSPIVWGQYSQEIVLLGTAHMHFEGGCPPFSWTGNNVSFVDGYGTKIDKDTLKKTRNLYVKSTDACSGNVKVYDICGGSLSEEISIIGQVGTVTGPSYLEPGTTGTFYHDLPGDVTYTGTLEMVQQSGGGAILRMPSGANGSYTASWTGSCGWTASMGVESSTCAAPSIGCGSVPSIVRIGEDCYQVSDLCMTGGCQSCASSTGCWCTVPSMSSGNPAFDGKPGISIRTGAGPDSCTNCVIVRI